MSENQAQGRYAATFLLSVYFGFQGVLYLIAVAYAFHRFETDNPEQSLAAARDTAIGIVVGFSFLVGALLLRRDNHKGLLWVALSLFTIIGQWLLAAPPPGYLVTFFISLIGVTVTWLELSRSEIRNHSLR
jgi:cyanate permease